MNNNKKFLQKVDQYKQGEDECWNWQGSMSSSGYGMYNNKFAHRISYEHFIGEIPKELVINHICENKLCVNPNHLEIATIQENSQYSAYKNRGERKTQATITNMQAKKVYELLEQNKTSREINIKTNISYSIINQIKSGMSWNHITGYPKKVYKNKPIIHNEKYYIKKFNEKVIKSNDIEECWEWIGNKRDDGYGIFYLSDRRTAAHRFSYEVFIQSIPEGLVINHLCENRGCVNPNHLESVTTKDNLEYSIDTKRKIKAKDLPDVQNLIENSDLTYGEIAILYGVTPSAINGIRERYNLKNRQEKRSKEEKEQIISLLNKGELSQLAIAKQFNTTQSLIAHYYKQYFSDRGEYKPTIQKTKKGSANGNSSLTEENVVDIKKKLNNIERVHKIAKEYGVSDQTIYRIKKGETWEHIKI